MSPDRLPTSRAGRPGPLPRPHRTRQGHPARLTVDDFEAYTEVRARHAKFYVAGQRHGLTGRVYVAVRLELEGFLRGAALAGGFITAILAAFAWQLETVRAETEAAVATLLIAPALLAYLLVRPSEHVLIGGFLAGIRRLVVLMGVWPLAAAVVTILVSSDCALRYALLGLSIASQLTTLGLLAPLIQGWRDRRRKRQALGRMEPEGREGDPDRLSRRG